MNLKFQGCWLVQLFVKCLASKEMVAQCISGKMKHENLVSSELIRVEVPLWEHYRDDGSVLIFIRKFERPILVFWNIISSFIPKRFAIDWWNYVCFQQHYREWNLYFFSGSERVDWKWKCLNSQGCCFKLLQVLTSISVAASRDWIGRGHLFKNEKKGFCWLWHQTSTGVQKKKSIYVGNPSISIHLIPLPFPQFC